jgi:hypothetical protein
MLAAPAAAQVTANLPVTCNPTTAICVQATPVTNPDGSLVGAGGGSATRTTAAGTSDTLAVPVQGVTGGVPQRITGVGQTTSATAQTVVPATDSAVFPTVARGGGSIATGQVSVGTTATLIAAARTGRQRITVSVGSAVSCAYGATGVTLTTGYVLQAVAGANDTSDTSAALYGVCASTATVSYKELF